MPTVEDIVKIGDEVSVLVTEIDRQGRINLSRRALLAPSNGEPGAPTASRQPAPAVRRAASAPLAAAMAPGSAMRARRPPPYRDGGNRPPYRGPSSGRGTEASWPTPGPARDDDPGGAPD